MAADHNADRPGLVADVVVGDLGHIVDLVGTVFVAVCDVVVAHIVVLCVVAAAAVGTVLVGVVRNLVLVVVVAVVVDVFAAVDFDCWLPCCRFWVLMFPRHWIPHSVHQACHQNPEVNNSLSEFSFDHLFVK